MKSGEILGVVGIAGSGQKELCEALAGLIRPVSGEISYQQENMIGKTPAQIQEMGIRMSFVPEDRLGTVSYTHLSGHDTDAVPDPVDELGGDEIHQHLYTKVQGYQKSQFTQ